MTLDDIVEKKHIVEGVHEIAGTMFNEMYSTLLKEKRTIELLRNAVMPRLVYPASKRGTQKNLRDKFVIQHSVEMI